MLDVDLARLYVVSTKALNQAFRRNKERFPSDFALQLSKEEFDHLRSQIVTTFPAPALGMVGALYTSVQLREDWLRAALYLMIFTGPGKFSVDRLLQTKKTKPTAPLS